jgi:hypothetical protein
MTQTVADQENGYPGRGTIGAKFLEGGSSGLNLQKAGLIFVDNGNATYVGFNDWGLYWTSTTAAVGLWWRGFNFNSPDAGPIVRTNTDQSYAMSVRCIKD